MEYSEFEKILLSQIKNKNEDCIQTIESNQKLIQLYFQNNEKPYHIEHFVNNLNDIILSNNDSFKLIEKVLKHKLFDEVLNYFKYSEIFINACKANNSNALKWLLTMDINYYIQDENGMTALMHAAGNRRLSFVVKELIKDNDDFIHLTDKNGENALFHAINNDENDTFTRLLYSKIDVNHQNNDGDTVLLYCAKNGYIRAVEQIIKLSNIDLDIVDKAGRNAVMYLLENEEFKIVTRILKTKQFDINYYNYNNNESFVSLIIKKYQDLFVKNKYYINNSEKKFKISFFGSMMIATLVYPGCDFNIPIDDDGNTPIMYFMMIEDYLTTSFILSDYPNVDLSIKNKHGVNASLLSTFIDDKEHILIKEFVKNKTFDTQYVDKEGNNLLIYAIINNNTTVFSNLVNEKSINHVNQKNEDTLIIATKLGFLENINGVELRKADINHQDDLGNTAMHYAIKLRYKYAVNLLAYYQCDMEIKNNEGVTANELVNQLEEKDILKIVKKPLPLHEMKKKIKNDSKSFLFLKKKKNTDQKVEEYIKNYQMTNYQKEYLRLVENIKTYEKVKNLIYVEEPLSLAYYLSLEKRKTFIPLICVNPQAINDDKKMAEAAFILF